MIGLMILQFMIWPLVVIGIIIFIVKLLRRRRRGGHFSSEHPWLEIAYSREDAMSQLFFVLAVFFGGLTLLSLNRNIGSPLSWQTIILITSLGSFACAYYYKILYALPFGIFGLAMWWGIKAALWTEAGRVQPMAILTGLILFALIYYLVGRAHEMKEKYKRFAYVYSIIGLLSITAVLFVFSMHEGLKWFEELTEGADIIVSWQLSVSLLLLIIGFVAAFILAFKSKQLSRYELGGVAAAALLFIFLLFLPAQDLFESGRAYRGFYNSRSFSDSGILWAFIFNILIFLEIVGIIFSGYLRREGKLINLGAFFLFVLILVKYFDWFYSFFDKSIFFISAGVLLFLVGWLMEKGRRYVLKTVKEEEIK